LVTGPHVSVDTIGMARAAQLFQDASSQAIGQLNSINTEMAALQATWRGDASLRFSEAMNSWEEEFQVIIRKLNGMVEAMGGNAQDYNTQSEQAANIATAWATGGGSGLSGL
jgi:WXG100 family type VII secretion target